MKKLLIILLIIGGLIMLRPINEIIRNTVGNIIHRLSVVTGEVAVDNGDGSYGVFIAGDPKIYPKIFTLARDPDIAVGDTVRILYKNGDKNNPIIWPPEKPTALPEEYELIFNQSYRAATAKTASDYVTAHSSMTGTAYSNPSGLLVEQQAVFPAGSYLRYNIYRSFLYFDTSTIPVGAAITEIELQIYIRLKWMIAGRDFNIVVQNGQPTYPHNPVISSDYYRNVYSGNGGEIASSAITTDAWNIITFNDDGKTWVNIGGETKFALRVSRDISYDEPPTPSEGEDNAEGIQLYGEPPGYILYARLVIKYTL